jgi:hypothetical protein
MEGGRLMKLKDPGSGEKDRTKRKEKRMKAWKKPKNKKERDDARAERCADWHGKQEDRFVGVNKSIHDNREVI